MDLALTGLLFWTLVLMTFWLIVRMSRPGAPESHPRTGALLRPRSTSPVVVAGVAFALITGISFVMFLPELLD